jgi:hypothetical protein
LRWLQNAGVVTEENRGARSWELGVGCLELLDDLLSESLPHLKETLVMIVKTQAGGFEGLEIECRDGSTS